MIDKPYSVNAALTPANLEDLGEGVTLEWLLDGRIMCLSLKTAIRPAVDIWIEHLKKVINSWPSDQLFLMTDASSPKIMMSPYLIGRMTELTSLRPDLQSFVALILGKGVFSRFVEQINNTIMFNMARSTPVTRQSKIFFSRAEALTWLQATYDRQQKQPENNG